MKSIILPCTPTECEKIISGDISVLIRKKLPKETSFKAYIYETKESKRRYLNDRFNSFFNNKSHYTDMGKVIGEFICDKVIRTCGWRLRGDTQQCAKRTTAETELPKLACLTIDEIVNYVGSEGRGVVGCYVSDLKIYDKPKKLSEFSRPCSYGGICYSCERFRPYSTPNAGPHDFCDGTITRPPMTYIYAELSKYEF